jgi:hypothetical protein
MRGLVFAGDRQIDYIDVPDPTPGPGEAAAPSTARKTKRHFGRNAL